MRTAAALLALLAAATAASAQSAINWSWTVSDTGNGNGIIEPGEQGIFRLHAQIVGGPTAYYASSMFNVLNTGGFQTGVITQNAVQNGLASITGMHGVVNPLTNEISAIDTLQLPIMLNPLAVTDNPIHVYTIRWQPSDYSPRTISAMSMHLTGEIYPDTFSTAAAAVSTPGVLTVQVIPAPGALALLGVAGLTAARRRRDR